MSSRADLRIAVEPDRDGQPTQRIYLDGHELPAAVRRIRVTNTSGQRTASLDLDLGDVSIDPRAIGEFRSGGGNDRECLTIDADTVDGSVRPQLLPSWTRGRTLAYQRPDAFDRARDLFAQFAQFDWLIVLGVTYLTVTVLGVLMEDLVLAYANGLRRPIDDR